MNSLTDCPPVPPAPGSRQQVFTLRAAVKASSALLSPLCLLLSLPSTLRTCICICGGSSCFKTTSALTLTGEDDTQRADPDLKVPSTRSQEQHALLLCIVNLSTQLHSLGFIDTSLLIQTAMRLMSSWDHYSDMVSLCNCD